MHVAHSDVRTGVVEPRDLHQSLRGVNPSAPSLTKVGKFDSQPATTRYIEKPVTFIHREQMV
jgi:hypothetical protein